MSRVILFHELFGTYRIGGIEHFNRLDSPDMIQHPELEWRFRSKSRHFSHHSFYAGYLYFLLFFFFKINVFKEMLTSACQTVLIHIRPDILAGII